MREIEKSLHNIENLLFWGLIITCILLWLILLSIWGTYT